MNSKRSATSSEDTITRRDVRAGDFHDLFAELPRNIQKLSKAAFARFLQDPNFRGLGHHKLADTSKGRHRDGSWAVHISGRYCAIYYPDGNTRVWYWIGTHADYDNFIGT